MPKSQTVLKTRMQVTMSLAKKGRSRVICFSRFEPDLIAKRWIVIQMIKMLVQKENNSEGGPCLRSVCMRKIIQTHSCRQ